MSRKTILISILAIIALFLGYKILSGSDQKKDGVWVGNKISASYNKGVINEPEGNMPPTSEIYIDASGSMKPYFLSDDPGMINSISEIVNLNIDSTKIFFLDNPTPYNGLVKNIITDVEKQPNLTATTFHKFFEGAACKIDTVNTIIYLVTDGIMSVSGDMSAALVQLRGLITNSLKGHSNLAGAIFRYTGGYKGDYWNCKNQRLTGDECESLKDRINRPYYIIALGQAPAIRWLQSIQPGKLNNPQEYFMGVHDYPGHCKATLALGDSTAIENMADNVTLILELPECLRDIDANKVQVTNNGNALPISVTKEGASLIAVVPPTQTLRPESDGRVKISFTAKNAVPQEWLTTWSTEDDIAGPDEMTTYGLKYLVSGLYEGLEGEQNLIQADFIYKRQ